MVPMVSMRGAALRWALLLLLCTPLPGAAQDAAPSTDLGALSQDLSGADGNARRRAAEQLGRLRLPEALPLLERAYDAEEADAFGVKAAVAAALGELGTADAARPLARILADPDYWVRRRAAEALGRIPGGEAARTLVNALQDRDVRVRAEAVKALGGHPDQLPRVVEALRDADPRVVAAALEALDAADAPQARDELAGALASDDSSLRFRAAALLARRGDERGLWTLEEGLGAPQTSRAALREAGRAGCGAVPLLAGFLRAAGEAGQELTLGLLEAQSCPQATEALLGHALCATCPAPGRVKATQALFDRRSALTVAQAGQVARLLGEEDADLLALALQVLLDAPGAPPLGRLDTLAFHPNQVVRHFALACLGRFGGNAQEATLVRALADANGSNVRLALEGLARFGTAAALPAIRPLAEDRLYRRAAEGAIEAIEGRNP